MQTQTRIKVAGYLSSTLTLIIGFTILYSETQQIISSFIFAALAAFMIWATFIIIGWLAGIIIK